MACFIRVFGGGCLREEGEGELDWIGPPPRNAAAADRMSAAKLKMVPLRETFFFFRRRRRNLLAEVATPFAEQSSLTRAEGTRVRGGPPNTRNYSPVGSKAA